MSLAITTDSETSCSLSCATTTVCRILECACRSLSTLISRGLKEYIFGDTVFDLVLKNAVTDKHLDDIRETCSKLYDANTNIDYFPTDFVENGGVLYYVDYVCNDYSEQWSFENWGIKYWSCTPDFEQYLAKYRNGL